MISHTHTHSSLMFTIVQVVQLEHRSNSALTWPCTSTWTHVWSGHQTHSWNSRQRSSQKWLDGHCHMWQRFCVSTWGCSAFSIDRPNKSQWSEKEGMDGAGGGRDTHEWLADLCDREGGSRPRGAWSTTLWPSRLCSCSWRLPFHCFRTKSLLT